MLVIEFKDDFYHIRYVDGKKRQSVKKGKHIWHWIETDFTLLRITKHTYMFVNKEKVFTFKFKYRVRKIGGPRPYAEVQGGFLLLEEKNGEIRDLEVDVEDPYDIIEYISTPIKVKMLYQV
jgi:hypothetical protein